jgi:hypothetical protein
VAGLLVSDPGMKVRKKDQAGLTTSGLDHTEAKGSALCILVGPRLTSKSV